MATNDATPWVVASALLDARELGFSGNHFEVSDLLRRFFHHAALVTHPKGEFRYGGYVLDVENGANIVHISKYDDQPVCFVCHGTEKVDQFDDSSQSWVRLLCTACERPT